MLSFLREQGHGDEMVAGPSGEVAEQSVGGSAGRPAGGDDYLTVESKDKKVRKSTYIFVVLFCVGLLCLWFMIRKSVPVTGSAAGMSAEEAEIEVAFEKLAGVKSEMFDRMDEIVNKFYEFSNVHQVTVNELVKNPFRSENYFGRISDIDTDARRLRERTGSMELLSIMQSGRGEADRCCMIDERILYEGDSIRGFEVEQIGETFVRLRSGEVEMVLKLSE